VDASIWGLFGEGTLVSFAQRDGSVQRQTTCAQPVHDMCRLPELRSFVWSPGNVVALLDQVTLQQSASFPCEWNRRLLPAGPSSVLCCGRGGANSVDVRSGETESRFSLQCGEASAWWCDDQRVTIGATDGTVLLFDRRQNASPLSSFRGGGEAVRAVFGERFAVGCSVRNMQDEIVASFDVPVTALGERVVGLRDGSLVLNDTVRLPLHSCAIERLATCRDRFGILSVSRTRGHGLALSEFLFNCEKAYTIDTMFATDP
jgi:hypothetical protein